MRSFGIVEFKLYESDFFLQKLQQATNIIEAEFYLSAFLSASRAVTFALQASLSDHPEFATWYQQQQEFLRNSDVAAWSLAARNRSQKQGARFIGTAVKAPKGQVKFVEPPLIAENETVVEATVRFIREGYLHVAKQQGSEDIVSKCRRHLIGLLTVIHHCFQTFGPVIDPAQYYSRENMVRLNKSVEDFEVELGFPPGWTAGLPEDRRIHVLRKQAGRTEIDELFCKYLGMDRFGQACFEEGTGLASSRKDS